MSDIQDETRKISFDQFCEFGKITGLSRAELRPLWLAMQPVLNSTRENLPAALQKFDLGAAAKEMTAIRNLNRVLDAARPAAEEPVI
jgi:hypothetical protein